MKDDDVILQHVITITFELTSDTVAVLSWGSQHPLENQKKIFQIEILDWKQ